MSAIEETASVRPRSEGFGQTLSSQGTGESDGGIGVVRGAATGIGPMAEVIVGSRGAEKAAPQGTRPRAKNKARNRNT